MKHFRRIGLVVCFVLAIGSALSAQDPSVLLEKAIYTEETLGNLSEAIGIYRQIVSAGEANRATSAMALFRLGMCYQKNGNTADAQAAFSKLTQLYPEQKDLISKIPASSTALEFGPAPWVDGEVLEMTIKTKSGVEAGTRVFRVNSAQQQGKAIWKLQSILETLTSVIFSSVLVDASSFAPISSVNKIPMMGMESLATYGPDRIEYAMIKNGTPTKTQVPMSHISYDSEQLPLLIRRLPLHEGFRATFPMSNSGTAAVLDAKVAVLAREKIAVPAGSFDCYKMVVTLASQEQTYWISDDGNSYLVKMDLNGLMDMELKSINILTSNQPVRFDDNELGISLSAPPQWYITRSRLGSASAIHIIGPEAESNCILLIVGLSEGSSPPPSPADLLDKMVAPHQKAYKEYLVRAGSRDTVSSSGLTGARLIADFKGLMTGQDTVQYLFAFTGSTKAYQLRFETDKGIFDRLRPIFDSIVFSLVLQ